ncbi:protein BCL9 homolog [Athalia rosae]|uniref:protein BCL9 homolog n=1 Tax=Athalia rosae TaxID=37344 RepID=UPI002033ECF7|nr:protein BCL9 homolog [Athalia rosae]
MKSEKKSTDLNCPGNEIVKEEPCKDPCKMSDKVIASDTDVAEGGTKPSNRESKTGASNTDDPSLKSNIAGGQALNPVKVENSSSYSTCNLSGDCGGASLSKSDSNALGKCGRSGSSSGDSQYMQQQSQIFVFSTMLANKGAEAVLLRQFPSIIAYHSAQPGTKKFLEKHPNKGNKLGQTPTEWLNNFTGTAGQKSRHPACSNNFPGQTPDLPVLGPDSPSFWSETFNVRSTSGEKSVGTAESSVDDTINKVVNSQPSPHSQIEDTPACGNSSPGGMQPSLQGVKVPDENLTPQQRQHREEQLATIRKMQLLLFSNRKEDAESSLSSTQPQPFRPEAGISGPDSPLDNFSSDVDWDKLQSQLYEPKNKVVADHSGAVPSPVAGNAAATSSKVQGPPPPYHQSTRPASVPAALQSSNPSSPNNPTSTLSLPSLQASSALNSPAGTGQRSGAGYLPGGSPMTQDSLSSGIGTISAEIENQLNHSNPGTPASHPHLVGFSPGGGTTSQKDSIDFPSSQSPSVDEIFCQTLQSVSQEQRDQIGSAIATKEANLMPVPSPQQIQYLNTFEGQELTIQKQPNTSLKDNNSPSNVVTTSAIRILSDPGNQCQTVAGSSPLTDNTTDRGFSGPLPSPLTPRTPTSNTPHTPFDSSNLSGGKLTSGQNSPATSFGQNINETIGRPRTLPESPRSKDVSPSSNENQQRMHHSNETKLSLQQNTPDFTRGRPPMNVRGQPDNVPLNPNNVNSCLAVQGSINSNHFDPITSLAQMSQQLVNITPSNNLGDGPIMHAGNPGITQGMHSMQDIGAPHPGHPGGMGEYGDMNRFGGSGLNNCLPPSNYSLAPRSGNLGIPNRAASPGHGPIPGYGGMHPGGMYHAEPRGPPRPMDHNSMRANVQVKPGAPNTIQYLPAKPNPCQGGPRAPPSLDFLQGFANPSNQPPGPNRPGFPNNVAGPHPGGPMYTMQQGVYPGMQNRPMQRPVGGLQTGNYLPMHRPAMQVNMHQGPNSMRMQHMVGGGVFPGNRMQGLDKPYGGDLIPQLSNQGNPRMQYMPGNQIHGNHMAIRSRAPPGQPMHPNMEGAGNGFKSGPFMGGAGPPTSDPNYAQQYHNFQQQLYATGTRGSVPQHPNNHMSANSLSFLPER